MVKGGEIPAGTRGEILSVVTREKTISGIKTQQGMSQVQKFKIREKKNLAILNGAEMKRETLELTESQESSAKVGQMED